MHSNSVGFELSKSDHTIDQVKALEKLDYKSLGLTASDNDKILAACKELSVLSQSNVSLFGQGLAQHSQKYADDLLTQVQNKDLEETGKKIDAVLKTARTINTKNLINQPKKGFFGQLFGKISNVKDNFLSDFKNTKEQVETLMGEVEKSQSGLSDRVKLLDTMFISVEEEHKVLGIYIAAGELKRHELASEIDKLSELAVNDKSNDASARLFELNAVANSLEKRISDLRMLQQSALQTLPMIRVIQSNNTMLIDKFNAIKTVTLPAWKNSISLALALNEQKNSVQLAEAIDNTTNDLLKANADLLHTNTINTAKANQRSVIDVETLEHVQATLIKTVSEMASIQQEGMRKRDDAAKRIKVLQENMSTLTISTAENTSRMIDTK